MEVSQLLVNSLSGKSKFKQRHFPPRDRTGESGEAWMFPRHVFLRWLKREELVSNVFVKHVQFRDCRLVVLCWQDSSQAHHQKNYTQAPDLFSVQRGRQRLRHRFSSLPKSKRSKITYISLFWHGSVPQVMGSTCNETKAFCMGKKASSVQPPLAFQ